ncbi:hypothetical protein SerAS12_4078 [Serratia sp. AS12]|uniref:hypothetical protein n=1 Tax=Serratia TaxID=613 RepID=UPI00020EA02A|nr:MULTISPECIES: hypothetical protein [Serratia]AEF47176.1 hypothetical protein SerAS9_4077 [Serratia plymuthica AS9]AEF52128.1 hypothetical protein SerAS12_4078 [Serratia sp. AS12]AEG29835.1 hypothetical protein SerAS13_4078 [Serratia sp. AS13]UTN95862.1 hypothetical protein NLX81_20750 [Serratia plymuthica]
MSTMSCKKCVMAGAKVASRQRSTLMARKRTGKNGLHFYMLREDQIKTRWTESEAMAIKITADAMASNPAVETNVAAIRGFLVMFAEAPEMLVHVHSKLKAASLPIPEWLPGISDE